MADALKGVDASVEQQDFVEDGQVRGPGGFEPAEIDGETEGGEDEEVAPVATLVGIGEAGTVEECGYSNREESVEREP